jgi:filamentous hemagglutinin
MTNFSRSSVTFRITVQKASRILFAIAICGLISCQQPPASSNGAGPAAGSTAARIETHPTNAPVRDLSRDEAAGGHILRKHVGQTEEQLRRRLERERNITGASTYTDRSTAEHVVGAAIAESQGEIQRWLDRSGRHPNLVLDYESADPIGRTMNRGENQSRPCSHALVVLKYDLKYAGPSRYYVLTSYPECRS